MLGKASIQMRASFFLCLEGLPFNCQLLFFLRVITGLFHVAFRAQPSRDFRAMLYRRQEVTRPDGVAVEVELPAAPASSSSDL